MEELISSLTSQLEPEIEDPEEETFLLYSQPLPSLDLGFIDPKASSVDVSVAGNDYTIHQSPTVLASSRAGGTTGAVLWRITPSFAGWLASPSNPLFSSGLLRESSSSVLELGCGISPLSALALGPRIARCVLTDQAYVQSLLQRNLDENLAASSSSSRPSGSGHSKPKPSKRRAAAPSSSSSSPSSSSPSATTSSSSANIRFTTLDWETDQVTPALTGSPDARSFDAVVACDCVYNYALVPPLVQTCADACRLREAERHDGDGSKESAGANSPAPPCLCVVGQQLRNDEVFETWLKAFHAAFRVWRVPDSALPLELRSTAGFVVHIGVLRD